MICAIPLSFLIFPTSIVIAASNIHSAAIITIAWIQIVTWVDVICKRCHLHPKYFCACALSIFISIWILLQYSIIHHSNTKKIDYYVFNLSMLAALIFFYIVSDFWIIFSIEKIECDFWNIQIILSSNPDFFCLFSI